MSLSDRRRHGPRHLVIKNIDLLPDTATPPPPSPGMQRAPFLRREARPVWALLQPANQAGQQAGAMTSTHEVALRSIGKLQAYGAGPEALRSRLGL